MRARPLPKGVQPYLVALGAILIAAAIRWALMPFVQDQAPYLFFVPAVLIAAGFGGVGPGLLATVLCLALILFGIAPSNQGPGVIINATAFGLMGCTAAWLGHRLHGARRLASNREAHLRSILATVPDALVTLDNSGAVQSMSPTAERMFGYSTVEMTGLPAMLLTTSAHRVRLEKYIDNRVGSPTAESHSLLCDGLRRDGTTFPTEWIVGLLVRGGERSFVGFVRDLSERRRAEDRLRQLESDLIRLSRVTMLGEMASAIAHEVNQPLAAIANYLKGCQRLLANSSGESELLLVREGIENAAGQALRAGEVIRHLRGFIGQHGPERRPESIRDLVHEALDFALIGGLAAGVAVKCDLADSHDLVLVDKVQIQQVLVNLIRNAVEAMEHSEPKELRLSTSPAPDNMLYLSVADSGAGLADEIRDKLFQPFRSTKPNGMGVGLSTCRTIIEAHCGRIEARPQSGGGTNFRFTVPLAGLSAAECDEIHGVPLAP
jgi:two-component system sensor kinase FixL